LVAALAIELHSTFGGRKPGRTEDHRKRIRRYETLDVVPASVLHSPSRGEEAQEKGDPLPGVKKSGGQGSRTC
jgi:hypothetical protein